MREALLVVYTTYFQIQLSGEISLLGMGGVWLFATPLCRWSQALQRTKLVSILSTLRHFCMTHWCAQLNREQLSSQPQDFANHLSIVVGISVKHTYSFCRYKGRKCQKQVSGLLWLYLLSCAVNQGKTTEAEHYATICLHSYFERQGLEKDGNMICSKGSACEEKLKKKWEIECAACSSSLQTDVHTQAAFTAIRSK